MLPQNSQRIEKLTALSPLDAVQAWLDGDFGLGEEDALIVAIRRDDRITISDEEINDLIMEAMEQKSDAATALRNLITSSQA